MAGRPLEGLHVVIVPTWYPTPEAPTGGRVFQEYIEAFTGAGARVGLLYPDLVDLGNWPGYARSAPYWTRVRQMGLPPWSWPAPREESMAGSPVVRVRGLHTSLGKRERRIERYAIWLERAFRHYAARHGVPDVLNPHCATPAGWAALQLASGLHPRPRVVLTEHTGPFSLLLPEPRIAERTLAACREADAIAAVGTLLRSEMQQAGVTAPIELIPNPVSAGFRFAEMPPPGRAANGRPSFTGLFVGRFTKKKGIPELAEAIERLARDPEVAFRWEFFGFGEKEEEARLRKLFASGPARGLGTVHGIGGREEIARVMRASHFHVLPSHRDNCPLAVVESLSMGRPVVGTTGTGVEYYVRADDGDGVLCQPGNVEDLTRALREVVRRDWDARAIAARAEARFSEAAIAESYGRMFRISSEPARNS